jgi:hypothetical protein
MVSEPIGLDIANLQPGESDVAGEDDRRPERHCEPEQAEQEDELPEARRSRDE